MTLRSFAAVVAIVAIVGGIAVDGVALVVQERQIELKLIERKPIS